MRLSNKTLCAPGSLFTLAIGLALVLAMAPAAADEDTVAGEAAEEVAVPGEEEVAAVVVVDEEDELDALGGIEEITVTATKRETILQETPIAVTAMTQDYMEQQVVNNANDYTLLVPSFSYRDTPNRAFIRGIGRNVNALGLDPGVAIYVDGVYTSETAALFGSSFGTERVEILRGPQGTLYGRSATGGAVNVISEKPSDEFHAKARFVTGSYDAQEYGVSVTGPIGGPIDNRIRYHFLFNHANSDGTIENLSGPDLGSVDSYYYRVQLEADITDDLNVWLLYDYYTYGNKGANFGSAIGLLEDPYAKDAFATSPLGLNAQYDPGRVFPTNPTVNDLHSADYNDVASVNLDPSWNVRGQATWDIDPVTLKYVGGYSSYDWESIGGDIDRTSNPAPPDDPAFVGAMPDLRTLEDVMEKKTYTSHELQVLSNWESDFQWLVGFYYYHESIRQPYSIYAPDNMRLETIIDSTTFAPIGLNPENYYYNQEGALKTYSYAGFADATLDFGEWFWDFLEDWSVTGGVRYSYDRKKGTEFQEVYADGLRYAFPDLGTCCAFDSSKENNYRRYDTDWNAWTGRVVLQYTPIEDIMVYGSFNAGYKPGGYNLGALQNNPVFDNEQVLAYELGTKTTLLEKHLQLNGTFFYYDYTDLQVAQAITDTSTGITNTQVLNADEASVFGIEIEGLYTRDFELLWQSNVTLSLIYSFLHARYDKFCCSENTALPPPPPGVAPPLFDLSGNPMTQAPDHKISTSLTYEIDTNVGKFSLTGRFSWVDKQLYSIFDDDRRWGDAYHRTDLLATWTTEIPALQDITIVGYAKNLEDDDNVNHVLISDNADLARRYVWPNLPRTWGIEIHLAY
jgi:iron complex outermembrane receptor protein